MAVPLILVFLTLTGVLVAGAAYQRRHAARNLVALLHRTEAYAVAEDAIREVVQRGPLEALMVAHAGDLAAAWLAGEWRPDGSRAFADLSHRLEAHPTVTRRRHQADPGLRISEVRLEIPEYDPGLRNQGTLRAAVRVERRVAGRSLVFDLALDYSFQLWEAGGRLRLDLGALHPDPRARVTT